MVFDMEIPSNARKIIAGLQENGYEAYAVGGCVRDSLLGKQPDDWDICTNALPEQTIACFPEYTIIETGLQHGTVTVIIERQPFEVTTFRQDGAYTDHRRPDSVHFVSSLRDDLSRRDFSINAMAYSPDEGLVDYFGGMHDLNEGTIRCVGEPDRRFNEDALRIMRALRFASVFQFEIEKETADSIHANCGTLEKIAAERLQIELLKLLKGPGAADMLENYPDVFQVFIPELKQLMGFEQHSPYHIFDVWRHTVEAIRSAPEDPVLRLALLLHDIAKPDCLTRDEDGIGHFYRHAQIGAERASQILHRLKFDNNTIRTVKDLVAYHDAQINPNTRNVKRWLNKIGERTFRQLLSIKRADIMAQSETYRDSRLDVLADITLCLHTVIEEQQCFSLKDLAVDGRDLIAAGITQGKQIGSALNWLLNLVLEEEAPNQKDILIRKLLLHLER